MYQMTVHHTKVDKLPASEFKTEGEFAAWLQLELMAVCPPLLRPFASVAFDLRMSLCCRCRRCPQYGGYCFYCAQVGLKVPLILCGGAPPTCATAPPCGLDLPVLSSAGYAYSISVERIRPKAAYGPKNCVLVCQCLQGLARAAHGG